jgi:hypothetical protein
MHSPPRTRPSSVTVRMDVHEATEIEAVRLNNIGGTSLIFRDQFSGTEVQVVLPDAEMIRIFELVGAITPKPKAGKQAAS